MSTLVIYYSYSGHTKAIAEALALKEHFDITQIMDVNRPGKLKAYFAGCFAAVRGKEWPIRPIGVDLGGYDRFIIMSPVWAGSPAPVVNAVLNQLPKNKMISVKMVSASGQSSCKERIEEKIKSIDGTLEGFEDIKA